MFTKGDETGSATIAVGNWTLSSKKDGELTIVNTDATQQQATILKEELPGFIFESNRGTRHSFTAETSLGPEFPAGWAGKKTKRLRNKAEALKQKVRSTARKVYENHFREAQSQPRGVVAKLTQIVTLVDKACQKQVINEGEWKILMTSALEELTELLGDDTKVSAYELHSSGLIQSLLKLFATSSTHQSAYPRYSNAFYFIFRTNKCHVFALMNCLSLVGRTGPLYTDRNGHLDIITSVRPFKSFL